MADYLTFRCNVICQEMQFQSLSQIKIKQEQQKLFQTMAIYLDYKIDSVYNMILTLIKIKTTKPFAVILYKIYEAVLCDKMLSRKIYDDHGFVALLLCYKKWKCLVNYKDEKSKINDIAERALPKILPPAKGFYKAFHKILPEIPAHKATKSMR